MRQTPRQLEAWLFVARRRHKQRLREFLSLSTTAARGKREAVKDMLDELDR